MGLLSNNIYFVVQNIILAVSTSVDKYYSLTAEVLDPKLTLGAEGGGFHEIVARAFHFNPNPIQKKTVVSVPLLAIQTAATLVLFIIIFLGVE